MPWAIAIPVLSRTESGASEISSFFERRVCMVNVYQGKNCIVTGASTGIGFGLSKKLLEQGAHVWLCSRTQANVKAAQIELNKFKDRVHFDVLDVRYAEQVTNYINGIAERGRIDYLFNNAGVGYKGRFTDATPQIWEDVMSCNLYGVVNGTTAVVPVMLRQGGGHIVNVSSVCGIVPLPYQAIYCASKYAVVGFSEALRYELADKNIRVTVVCPGPVDTMIFRRNIDYTIVSDVPSPPESISPEQAAEEILEGLKTDRGILPITDFARQMYENTYKNPASVDATMKIIKQMVDDEYKAQEASI
jgi:short-subunit dehydrogenase